MSGARVSQHPQLLDQLGQRVLGALLVQDGSQPPRSLVATSSPRFRPGVAPRGIGEGVPVRERALVDVEDALSIGERARQIRCRRGLRLEVAGGLAGISGPYLSTCRTSRRGQWLS
jgi:hypothetical protein